MNKSKKIVKESYEVSPELVEKLNAILADEWLAAEQYKLAAIAMRGNKQHRIEEIAEKNAKDELEDHFDNLCDWMQSKGLPVDVNRWNFDQNRHSTKFDLKEGMSTKDVVDILIKGEEEAIEDYEQVIPETDLDLKVMLCGFLKDEREHLKELKDCRDEMGGGEEKPKRPNVFEKKYRFDERMSDKSFKYLTTAHNKLRDVIDDLDRVGLVELHRKALALSHDIYDTWDKEVDERKKPVKVAESVDGQPYMVMVDWGTMRSRFGKLPPWRLTVVVPQEEIDDDNERNYIRRYLQDEYGPFADFQFRRFSESRKVNESAATDFVEYEVYDIDWDSDGSDVELPSGVYIDVPNYIEDEGLDSVEEWISDALSDEYGFCHFGFSFERT